ncbi:MAG TPA: PfkB family carbohydrate kinase [Thermoplasmata archaeon]|nr:PfkB family carbohydrate kinase [Thermoplasmata archaeon]
MAGPIGRVAERPRQLLVAGHVNIDRFVEVARMPQADRTVPVRSVREALGGTAATIARVAASLHVRTGLLSRVGDGFPRSFGRQLRLEGIDLAGLERVAGAPSPTCYILHDARGHQVSAMLQGPMGDAARAPIPERLLRRYGWLHLTTGDPRFQLRLKAAALRAGLRVAVDPAQELNYWWTRGPLARLLAGSELLFTNSAELGRVLELLRLGSPRELLRHVPLIVTTLGPRGAVAYSRAGTVRVAAPRIRSASNATGAGDAFRGGFYAAWFAGLPLGRCLTAGSGAAGNWIRGERPSSVAGAGG